MSSREERYRYSGLIFFLSFLTYIFSTKNGIDFLQEFMNNYYDIDLIDSLLPIVGLGIAIFTAEPIGYLFNQIYIMIWNLNWNFLKPDYGGYSSEWSKIEYNIKDKILEELSDINQDPEILKENENATEKLKDISLDVISSYFMQYSPTYIQNWILRRYSIFFTNRTNNLSLFFSTMLSLLIIHKYGFGFSSTYIIVMLFWFFILLCFFYNAKGARTQARHMLELWLIIQTNNKIANSFKNIEKMLKKI